VKAYRGFESHPFRHEHNKIKNFADVFEALMRLGKKSP
jgi:hypothetical protein